MIRAYLVDHFHHPETGQVLLVKMTGLPELSRSVSRVLAHGDWGECEFRITSCRWPDQPNPTWDIALTTQTRLDWNRCQELILYFD
ncbi:hypothetical protein ABS71_05425 [bacterium SCN 62-11]|nr:MAG: hypothetical protein ABS71_05425 [bacterium SCN 62-11]